MKKILVPVLIIFIELFYANHTFAQWVQTNGPYQLHISNVFGINGHLFAGTVNYGIFVTTDEGLNWDTTNTGIPYGTSVNTFAGIGTSIIAGSNEGIFVSQDTGKSWVQSNSGLPANIFIVCLLVRQQNPGTLIFAGTNDGIYLSSDNGSSWTEKNSGVTNLAMSSLVQSADKIYASSFGGIYLSTNNGDSWTSIGNNFPNLSYPLYSLALINGTLFVGTYTDGVYSTTDDGLNWATIRDGLPYNNILDYYFLVYGQTLFAGTEQGFYCLYPNDTTWIAKNDGLNPTHILTCLTLFNSDSSGTYIYAGTDGAGVWKRPLDQVTSVNYHSIKQPVQFALEQNYPNPFNPTTKIEFRISHFGFASLKIYDALGREVATLVNGYKKQGSYTVEWNAEKYASGVYFYRLQAGKFSETKKLLLLK